MRPTSAVACSGDPWDFAPLGLRKRESTAYSIGPPLPDLDASAPAAAAPLAAAVVAALAAPPATCAPARTPPLTMVVTAEVSTPAVNKIETAQVRKPCAVSRKTTSSVSSETHLVRNRPPM